MPVRVNTPPRRRAFCPWLFFPSKPIGVKLTSISPASIWRPVSGFVPILWLVISLLTCLFLRLIFPYPYLGIDVSFDIIVKFLTFVLTSSSISLSGCRSLKTTYYIMVALSFMRPMASFY